MPAFRDIVPGAAPFGAGRSVETAGGEVGAGTGAGGGASVGAGVGAAIAPGTGAGAEPAATYATRSGRLSFEASGYPTEKTVRHLREEIDYQRAVQAYIHYLPAVATMQWRDAHFGPLGGGGGDLIVYRSAEQKLPILAADGTTPLVAGFADLAETGGMLVYEVPSGPTAGVVLDLWQRPVAQTGATGPDAGKGGRVLIVLEGTQVPEGHGADVVVTSRTSTIMVAARILTPDPREAERIVMAHRLHALGAAPARRIFEAPNRDWSGHQPRGLDYWMVVHRIVQLNPPEARDMAVLHWLRTLGIEKGRAFEPTPGEEGILDEAAFVGEAWAMGNSFLGRAAVRHWPDDPTSQWQDLQPAPCPLEQMAGTHIETDARAAAAYRALPVTAVAPGDGGPRSLAAFRDGAGRWLDGANAYALVVSPDVPVSAFWSLVLYDADTRCMIENAQGRPEVNSRQQLVAGEDGAVRLVFAPAQPDGVPAANWIQTNPDMGFFACLHLYAPTADFFDRSWKIGNIEQVTATIAPARGTGR